MKKTIPFLTAGLLLPMSALAVTPLWLRDVQISPNGSEIAFCYKGDIWKVSTTGGKATRLTTLSSYESRPVWSPDGKQIAFASDRHGNFDVFVMDATGGQATRLTSNSSNEYPETFSTDGKDVYFSAAIQDPASSVLFPSTRLTELYAVPSTGGASRQVLGTPAQAVNWGNDFFLYQDQKGMEDEWRKHHTSSVTRDIWKYDTKTGKHTNLTAHAGEDRNPIVDGDKFYFLSERNGGSMNVYQASIANASQVSAVTNFSTHPVRFLSRGNNGLLCFTYDGEIYTQAPGAKPVKVNIDVVDDLEEPIEKIGVTSGASEAVPSPDGKSMAFIYRGEVFVTSVEYSTTKQITKTAEAESFVTWSPDSKTLYYTSERDGIYNIYKAEMARPNDEANFANATTINETAMFSNDGIERMHPMISPDGKQMAFVQDRNKLMTMDLKTKTVRQLTDGSMNPTRTGDVEYSWSPDSKWILLLIDEKQHYPYDDVAILNVASGKITNLTNSGYTTQNARWALDGNAIMFATEEYGMRNHASWGSQDDVMLIFMNQDAYDKYKLSEEDYAIRKDLEKKDSKEKDADKDSKKSKSKDKKKDDDAETAKSKDIVVELDGITERVVRLTPMSVNLRDAIITKDGDWLYYIANANNGTQLWKLNLRKDEHKMVSKVAGARGFDIDKDGKNMFIIGSSLNKFEPGSDKLTPISYSATMNLDHAAERTYMFDYMSREEGARFYTTNMHGIDWPAMTAHYRQFLPHINNNYDFAELLSEILGELNVSHTGGRYYEPYNYQGDRTASLGLLYDMTYTGDGFKVDEVLEGGPFNNAKSKVAKGMIIEKINGEEIKAGEDNTSMLTDIAGRKTLVSIYDPATNQRWDEVILPISSGKQNDLLYRRWVLNRQADVQRWSNGRLGYVHIKSMADGSFRTLYSDVLGKYNNCEGIVIDIRWNGGGRMHEDIEVMFTGQKYLTQEVRGTDVCDMPSRRWNKPSVMLMCEACYSNAHGTPWVYKHQNIGKLVGAPVPGTMTSVNWVTMQDPTMVFGIPVVGYRTAEGTYLENAQLEPDVYVLNSPETVVKGEDTQLRTAVETLLKDLDAQKK
jgi:Tol biopolymer transport system component/C-terminal processing protease CtpA/Prc